jgi:hypothetical protein
MTPLESINGCVLFYGFALAPWSVIFLLSSLWTTMALFVLVVKSCWRKTPLTGFELILDQGLNACNAMLVLAMAIYHSITTSEDFRTGNASEDWKALWRNYENFFVYILESGGTLVITKLALWFIFISHFESAFANQHPEHNQVLLAEWFKAAEGDEALENLSLKQKCKLFKLCSNLFPITLLLFILIPIFATHFQICAFIYCYVTTFPLMAIFGLSLIVAHHCGHLVAEKSLRSVCLGWIIQVFFEAAGSIILQNALHYMVMLYSGENYVSLMKEEYEMRTYDCYLQQVQTEVRQYIALLTWII